MREFTLRPYQRKDVDWMKETKKVYNCLDMGCGKTLESLVTLHETGLEQTLIIAPKIATGVWKMEAMQWFDWESTIYTGTPKQRAALWEQWNAGDTKILITNPAQAEEILKLKKNWKAIIIDEAHLAGLLNHKTKTYKAIAKLESEYMILLTGTPIRRNLADLYGPLHLLNPKKFDSYWKFVNKYCMTIDNGFGQEILSKPKNPLELKRVLSHIMVRHTKQEVLQDLPVKIRSVIPVEMNKKQAKAYNELEDTMMLLEDVDEITLASSAMVQTLRLRQLLVCPRMLGVEDDGAALKTLVEDLIPNDFEDNRSVIICTPFRKAVPYIVNAIQQSIPGAKTFEIHGDIKTSAAEVAAEYQGCRTIKKILIYTIKSGASFTATDASVTYFLGAEWSNVDNFQAEDRCYRIGQSRGVDIRYMCYNGTVDDVVKHRLNEKSLATHWVLNPVKVMKEIQEKKKRALTKLRS